MKRPVGAVVLPLLALAAACGENEPVLCPVPLDALFAVPASVLVTVVDSTGGQSLLAGAHGRWIMGAETDSLRHWGNGLAAIGPAGRYTVIVEAPGYRAWARDDIRVRRDECGPVLEEVTARLQRE